MPKIIDDVKQLINDKKYFEARQLLDTFLTSTEVGSVDFHTGAFYYLYSLLIEKKYDDVYSFLSDMLDVSPKNPFFLFYLYMIRFFVKITYTHNLMVHEEFNNVLITIASSVQGDEEAFTSSVFAAHNKNLNLAHEGFTKWQESMKNCGLTVSIEYKIIDELIQQAQIVYKKKQEEKKSLSNKIIELAEQNQFDEIKRLMEEYGTKYPLCEEDRAILCIATRLSQNDFSSIHSYKGHRIFGAINDRDYDKALELCSKYENKRNITRGPLMVMLEKAVEMTKRTSIHPTSIMILINSVNKLIADENYSLAESLMMEAYYKMPDNEKFLLAHQGLLYPLIMQEKYADVIIIIEDLERLNIASRSDACIKSMAELLLSPNGDIHFDPGFDAEGLFSAVHKGQYVNALAKSNEYVAKKKYENNCLNAMLQKMVARIKQISESPDIEGYNVYKNYFDELYNRLIDNNMIEMIPLLSEIPLDERMKSLEYNPNLDTFEIEVDGEKYQVIRPNLLLPDDHLDKDRLFFEGKEAFENKDYSKCIECFTRYAFTTLECDYYEYNDKYPYFKKVAKDERLYYVYTALGVSYKNCYDTTRNLSDLDKAISFLMIGCFFMREKGLDKADFYLKLLRVYKSQKEASLEINANMSNNFGKHLMANY